MVSNQDRVEQVEAVVDQCTLLDTVTALELMCYEKAEHLRVNWRDKASATQWERAAKALYTANLTIVKTCR